MGQADHSPGTQLEEHVHTYVFACAVRVRVPAGKDDQPQRLPPRSPGRPVRMGSGSRPSDANFILHALLAFGLWLEFVGFLDEVSQG